MFANMAAAGIKPEQITRVIVSHFHPDHFFGLMEKAPDNTPVFPNGVVYVPSNEYKFWMDESIFSKLAEKKHGLPKRLQAMFPLLKDKLKQYEWDTEVIPGIRSIAAPGHTPGHTAFHVASGNEQLMVLSDTTNMPALFAKHPDWHGVVDADPVLAEATRRKLFDRVVSDKALVTPYHSPFPPVTKRPEKNATLASFHLVPADPCRSPQGYLLTMRGRRRGYSNAPGFRVRPRRYGSCGCIHGLQVSGRDAPFFACSLYRWPAQELD